MTAPLAGWLAFGTFDCDAEIFIEAQDYERPRIDIPAGEILSFSRWTPIGGPAGFVITHGALFATETNGFSPLLCWRWAPLWLEAPGSWAPFDLRMDLASPVAHAVAATAGTEDIARLDVARGSLVGHINGMPVTAACRLAIAGGQVIARAQVQRRPAA
jgi:hypothetical protein